MIFGCRKDKIDKRDYLMRAYLPVVKLPKKVDYTSKMTPVRDQGNEGTCVGFASTVGMKEYQEKQDWRKLVELSPRFLYSECKKVDKMPGEGTTIRVAMQVLKKAGVCKEALWPYKPHQTDKPKPGYLADAKTNRVKSYARIVDLFELKSSLASIGPCVIGIQVFNGMMDAASGKVPMPRSGERSIGGHAICAVGYDESKGLVKFKNSWSVEWGDKGYGYLKYEYIDKYMMDAWSSIDIVDNNPLTLDSIAKFL